MRVFCGKINREIGRKPLRECKNCAHLLYVSCPKFEAKKHHVTDDMSRFFSSNKEGEVQPKKYCAEEPDCEPCEIEIDCAGQELRTSEQSTKEAEE